ncbi:MAG: TonB-dependent receptor [Sphingobium sp.]|nr:TonB-dependent receptor [Sphingobium sp.]
MKNFRSALMGCAAMTSAIAVCSLAPVALAQTENSESSHAGVEDIVVTAQFRAQNLQDTPIAITAMSADMMNARSQTNISQVAAQAPGINLQPNNANFGPSMAASIRGVGQYDPSPAVEPGVGFYVDDVYYPSLTGAIFDLLDLDRVEILRGPQGTLAGRNSIGGAVKLYSKRPVGSNDGMVQIAYGSRDRIDMRGSFDFHLTGDLNARIAVVSKKQDGYVDVYDYGCVNPQGSANNPAVGGVPATRLQGDCRTDRNGDVNYQAIRGQLRYNPSDVIDVLVSGDYVYDSRSQSASVLLSANNNATGAMRGPYFNVPFDSRFICGRYCNYSTGVMAADPANGIPYASTRPLRSKYEGFGLSGQVDIKLSDEVQFTSITGYREFQSSYAADADLSPLPVNGSSTDIDMNFFSQELRLNGSFADGRINTTIGGYYSHMKSVFANIQDIRYAGLQFASLGDEVPSESLAMFGHIAWELTDGLTITGGIRRTREEKDYTFSRRFADGSVGQPIVGSLDGVTGFYRETRWDYRANLQYEWAPNVMTYAQFSTGYKGGGINPRPYFPSQVRSFGSESIKAYEIGMKSDLFDRKMRLNLSAYLNKYQDIQLVLTSCPQFTPNNMVAPCSMTANAGDADVKGFEVETTLRPVDGLLIDASASYIDFEYKRIAAAASGPTGVRLTDVAPFMSKWKWAIGAQYEAKFANGSSITPRIDATYQSGLYAAARNDPTSYVPSYTLVNGRITWRNADRDLELSAEVTNVMDKYYLQTLFDQTLGQGSAMGQPGRPREWALTVTKRF